MTWTWLPETASPMQAVEDHGGFPRKLDESDADSFWLTDGTLYVWMEIIRTQAASIGNVHLSLPRDKRRRYYFRPLLRALERLQVVLDLDMLLSLEDEHTPIPKAMHDYMQRLGWKSHPHGYYKPKE